MSAAHGRRYPITVVTQARQLAADEWTPTQITRLLNRRGIPVTRDTVTRWIDEKAHARRTRASADRLRRERAANRLEGSEPWLRSDAGCEYRMARLQVLVRAGLPAEHVARVLTLDFGVPISGDVVRRVLDNGNPPAAWTRKAA